MKLTKAQTERQDMVDNAIHNLLAQLSGREPAYFDWDMERIGPVRDAAQEVLVDGLHLMTEMEFYPYTKLHRETCATCVYRRTCQLRGDQVNMCKAYAEA